jgi:bifunctional non-homologous end joining protein LigD
MARAGKGKTARSAAGLGEYERKRDFGATAEPCGAGKSKPRGRRKGAPRFVVQEHSARRLHWDLRLEREGVAASWAVPNGIPLDPDQNRKAVHTEDHPLEYLEWEGEIPAGQYGAGTMRIWDRGTYECHEWEPGKVVFSFEGERLRGRYALFHAGRAEKDWMIHRIDPAAERRDPFPQPLPPMLARAGRLPRRQGGWATELKWEGTRAIALCRPGRLELRGADLGEVTSRYPEVRRMARQLGSRDAVLDGVLVAFDEAGQPSAERLAVRAGPGSDSTVRRRMKSHPVTYVIFDLLYLEGRNLEDESYERRRALLDGLELSGESWQVPAYATGQAKELLAASRRRGLPGIVLKRLDSVYEPGRRAESWIEVASGAEAGAGSAAAGSASSLTAAAKPKPGGRAELFVGERRLAVSNLGKVLYPRAGFTKGQLIDYYAAVAEVLLPHLRGRPLTLKRYPNGVEGGHFYEKRCPKHRPEWMGTAKVWSERHREEIEYCLVEDLPSLVWAANLADIELHTSLSLAAEIERPTAMVFDLDPGAPADILDCARVGLWLRGMFEQLGLNSHPKASGSKGMQVYVPLNTEVGYEQTKPFARQVAETLEAKFPDRVVSRMTKAERPGKVLIDWSQNDQHKTTVCVYSLRAKERPTVSAPLDWDEVESALEAGDAGRLTFDHEALLARVAERGDLFAPLLSERQSLP